MNCLVCFKINCDTEHKKDDKTMNFIREMRELGKEYDYSKTDCRGNNRTKIDIICNKTDDIYGYHGVFTQILYSHIRRGCAKCARRYKWTTPEWIIRANQIHDNRYDYSKTNYETNKKPVEIICSEHGMFKQRPDDHLNGRGCAKCGGTKRYTLDEFIEKSKAIFENKFDYTDVVYKNNKTPVQIKCVKHDKIFFQFPESHLKGHVGCLECLMCPICNVCLTRGFVCQNCRTADDKKRNVKIKELEVVQFLKEKIKLKFRYNQSIGQTDSGSRRYPDILYDCGKYYLIVEIDERKHTGKRDKDDKRMEEIVDIVGLPCIFIRYNPDSKESDKDVLLKYVQKYLKVDLKNPPWNETYLKVEKLFY